VQRHTHSQEGEDLQKFCFSPCSFCRVLPNKGTNDVAGCRNSEHSFQGHALSGKTKTKPLPYDPSGTQASSFVRSSRARSVSHPYPTDPGPAKIDSRDLSKSQEKESLRDTELTRGSGVEGSSMHSREDSVGWGAGYRSLT